MRIESILCSDYDMHVVVMIEPLGFVFEFSNSKRRPGHMSVVRSCVPTVKKVSTRHLVEVRHVSHFPSEPSIFVVSRKTYYDEWIVKTYLCQVAWTTSLQFLVNHGKTCFQVSQFHCPPPSPTHIGLILVVVAFSSSR